MYSSFERRDRITLRVVLTVAWFSSAVAGLIGIIGPPASVQNEVGIFLSTMGSIFLLVFGVVAGVGTMANRYWLEWAAAFFASGGTAVYVAATWGIVIGGGHSGRAQTAALLTALLSFTVYRVVACAAHARRQRLVHEHVKQSVKGLLRD